MASGSQRIALLLDSFAVAEATEHLTEETSPNLDPSYVPASGLRKDKILLNR